jgi:lycopene cyclase domain-containing protein
MTYLQFLLLFVIVPGALLWAWVYLRPSPATPPGLLRRHWIGCGLLALIALGWTTPWDNYIVARGVWSYGEGRVLGTIGTVPIEEYAFMLLMPVLNAAVLALALRRAAIGPSNWRSPQSGPRLKTAALYLGLWLAALIGIQWEKNLYLCITLLWFLPPLAVQGLFDPRALLRHRRLVWTATLIPTLYLSVVDGYAIRDGIWTIHEATRTGLDILGLPFEEAFFFFITSFLLARGLVLWHSLFARPQ